MPKRKRGKAQTTEAKAQKEEDDQGSPSTSKRRGRPAKSSSKEVNKKVAGDVQLYNIQSHGKDILCERIGTETAALIFTHGAGGDITDAAMQGFASGFTSTSSMILFSGTMNLNSRVKDFQAVLNKEGTRPALGGRSMGARAAVLAAQKAESGIKALILASYPMTGAKKGDSREQILLDLPEDIDVLFISGSNDSMCDMKHLHAVVQKMKARSWVLEVQGADHGMKLKEKAGTEQIRRILGNLAAVWLTDRDESKRYCSLNWVDGAVIATGWQSDPTGEEAEYSSRKD